MSYKKYIQNLERKFSETNIATGECLSDETISQINKTYNSNQQQRRVDGILNNVRNKNSIQDEVHKIVKDVPLKSLCKNCKEELIIAVIILYVQRTRNPSYKLERTGLWSKYNLTWTKYSLIIERLLQWTREQKTFIETEDKVDNEDLIKW